MPFLRGFLRTSSGGRALLLGVAALLASVVPRSEAQQVGVHASYVAGDAATHFPIVGGGVDIGRRVSAGAAFIGLRLGAGYAREEHLGPGRGSVGADVTLSPRSDVPSFIPYLGGGVSMNWSGGKNPAWSGVRRGVEAIAGVDLAIFHTDLIGLEVEGRYGGIESLPRQFTSRIGLVTGF
jgi:hypothetical protein